MFILKAEPNLSVFFMYFLIYMIERETTVQQTKLPCNIYVLGKNKLWRTQ